MPCAFKALQVRRLESRMSWNVAGLLRSLDLPNLSVNVADPPHPQDRKEVQRFCEVPETRTHR